MPYRPLRTVTCCVAAIIVVAVPVLWGLPWWLTRHPPFEAAERHTAIAAARVGIVAYLVALGAGGSLFYTARTYRLTQTGQVTDRFTKAIGQLGDAARDVRIGAIFALERITKDSPEDQPTIMEVLTAYVREHAPRQRPVEVADKPPPDTSSVGAAQEGAEVRLRDRLEQVPPSLVLHGKLAPQHMLGRRPTCRPR